MKTMLKIWVFSAIFLIKKVLAFVFLMENQDLMLTPEAC